MPIVTGKTLAELRPGDQADLFVLIESIAVHRTRSGDPFFLLDVADRSGPGLVRVFEDHKQPFELCRQLDRRDVIKLRAQIDKLGLGPEMKVQALRRMTAADGVDLAALAGPLPAAAEAVAWGAVAFDIETMPRLSIDELPERERGKILRWAEEDARRDSGLQWAPDEAVGESVRKALALNSLTNQVVSIAFHALDSGQELAVVACPEGEQLEPPILGLREDELLRLFWRIARRARSLIGFNSRRFDVPVLLTRSALLGVDALGQDLLSDRFGKDPIHVDLQDVLAARGAASDRRTSLELASFAFGIAAKTQGHGSEVGLMVEEGRFHELAGYNLEDARATARLYQRLRGTWIAGSPGPPAG